MNDFLDDRRGEISERLKELKPFVDEFNRLEEAASALAGVVGTAASSAGSVITGRRKPGRPRGTRARKKASTRTAARATATRSTGTRRKAKRAAAKPKAAAARKPGRPPAKRRAGRRKGSGTRAAEALSFVQGQPGITIPELAAKMGIKQNYLYRVLPGLESEKKVQKKDRGWYPKG